MILKQTMLTGSFFHRSFISFLVAWMLIALSICQTFAGERNEDYVQWTEYLERVFAFGLDNKSSHIIPTHIVIICKLRF